MTSPPAPPAAPAPARAAFACVPLAWPLRALLAWAFAGSIFAMLPWVPWKVRFTIGRAIDPSALFVGEDDEALRRALVDVEGPVQALVRVTRI
jgi:hypothetical protein